MPRIWIRTVSCLLFLLMSLSAPGYGVPRNGLAGVPLEKTPVGNEILVKPAGGVPIQTIADRYQLVVIDSIPELNLWRLRQPAGAFASDGLRLAVMTQDEDIEYSQPNGARGGVFTHQESLAFVDPSDPPYVEDISPAEYFSQGFYEQIYARAAWVYSTGEGVRVAIVDTGVDTGHPALDSHLQLDRAWNFIDNNNDPTDRPDGRASGHGTYIAGLIARVAPGAKIIPIRAIDPNGVGTIYDVAQAICYAVSQGAHVINLSMGLRDSADAIDNALEFAHRAGVTVVASAGNDHTDEEPRIASYETAIGVAAVDAIDRRAGFSNYGSYISVSSPGVALYSTYLDGQFATWSGTSFSTALVSAQAALLRAQRPTLSPREVKRAIKQSADNIDRLNPGYAGELGTGRINCLRMVSE